MLHPLRNNTAALQQGILAIDISLVQNCYGVSLRSSLRPVFKLMISARPVIG